MNLDCMPIVRITLHNMTHEIMSAIGIEGSELSVIIGEKVKESFGKAVKDIELKVNHEVEKYIAERISATIKNYFTIGAGQEIIENKVWKLLDESMNKL